MAENAPTQVKLQAEDAQRVRRLTEEVRGRLEEMALIVSRALGRNLETNAVRKFVPVTRATDEGPAAAAATSDHLLYIELVGQPDGSTACVLHCPGHEVFIENPCGSGPIPCPPP